MTTEEINWHRVYTARIGACCAQAARDFNIPVESPYTLEDADNGTTHFIAYFPSLGSGNGMLVCLKSEWDNVGEIAQRHGYSCAGLDPEQYNSYDRERWRLIVETWAQS